MITDKRELALSKFAQVTGLHGVQHLIQRGRDPDTARFSLVMDDGREVRIGTIERLLTRSKFNQVIGVALGTFAASCKPAEWQEYIAAIVMHATEVTELDDELLERRVADWLDRYARSATAADREGAIAQRMPFLEDDHLYVSVDHLAVWVRRDLHEQIREPELRGALRDLGFEAVKINYTTHNSKRRSSARYYSAPLSLIDAGHDQ